MFWNQFKTVILLTSLSSVLVLFGFWVGGTNGIYFALILSLLMNFLTYFFSDKLVLSMYGAQKLDEEQYSHIYDMIHELSMEMHIPMPKLWYLPTSMANAFATGRNPKHGSVAVTQGILDILDVHELRGVLAHELSHIKNRDILVATIAATIATAIGFLANMVKWAAIFGGSSDREKSNGGVLGALVAAIIMPLAAMLIQLAISRSREYLADETGAEACKDPLALASALERLHFSAQNQHLEPESTAQASVASLFIVYPFSASGLIALFSTHPPMEKRIAKLRAMAK
ncbi:TPA: protease HtpX [Candidatus Dependentiae bacterium]|nr:MAG: Protease HtpX-like protein [candidate division TM6 bacterium GW2011_GWE2_31_21]KKP53741.1 MAG: Protease HtpX-like protein [candidate division TM6 bacterium GW2011_GWF2_33_332]HBS48505.1 protease HtpX [Candidatus Dependentiae bacterium]HBZ73120.1 protease HtpX [Candidatus Dependentiae bacterium]